MTLMTWLSLWSCVFKICIVKKSFVMKYKVKQECAYSKSSLFWKSEKAGKRNPTVIFENGFASQGTRTVIPYKKPWWLSDFFFFFLQYFCIFCWKTWKEKKNRFLSVGSSLISQTFICYLCNTAQNILKSRWTCGKKLWKTMHAMKPVPQTGYIWHQFLWLSHGNNQESALFRFFVYFLSRPTLIWGLFYTLSRFHLD